MPWGGPAMNNMQRCVPQYDAYVLWILCTECQYACVYCIGARGRKYVYGPDTGKNIDCKSLLASLDRMGLICRIGLCGGEPMSVPNIIEICHDLTQKHYIGVNTNLTMPNAKHFVTEIDPSRVTQLTCSLHIDEAERTNTLSLFIENSYTAALRGFHMTVLQVAYPPLLPRSEELREMFTERKIPFTFSPFTGEYKGKKYPASYTDDEMRRFDIPSALVHFHVPKNPCNAGFNTAVILADGCVIPCHNIVANLGHLFLPGGFTFNKELMKCELKTCTCASYILDPGLYQKALNLAGR